MQLVACENPERNDQIWQAILEKLKPGCATISELLGTENPPFNERVWQIFMEKDPHPSDLQRLADSCGKGGQWEKLARSVLRSDGLPTRYPIL
jgi:hypothetical protein